MIESFEGIWIPREIALNNNFTIAEKYLYSFIVSLCKKTGSCTATNDYLSECLNFCGVGNSQPTISSGISKLKDFNYLAISYVETEKGKLRVITLKDRYIS